ncbi:MAG: ABC transporter ATP-binding protein [Ruminococcaceae bacterium]|nr:ABC transporter ATP-binding protein [Oscillospiraceae bacterium]
MIKKLAGCIREYKLPSILSPIFITLEVIVECIIPFIVAKLINGIEEGKGMDSIIKYGVILVILAIVSLSMGALAGHFCAIASCGFAKNLRQDLYYKVQEFSFHNIDKFSTSSLVTRLTTDVNNVQMAFMMIIRTAIRAPLMIVFAFVMTFAMSPKISTLYIVLIPFLAFALLKIATTVMPIFKRIFKKYDALNNSVQENVRGMRVVKSYVREEYEKEKFKKASEEVRNDFTRVEKILALNDPIMQFCMNASTLGVSFFGSILIINTTGAELNVGNFSSIMTYGAQILMSLMMFSMIFVMLTMSAEAARRIVEVLDEKSTIVNPNEPVMQVSDGSIDFDGVSFKYSENAEKMALSGIDLHIKSGETVGILGSTGSSKTSLVQLIPRLYDVSEGCVKVGGIDVRNYDIETLRNEVAMVLQKNVLFSGTVKENLCWGNKDASDEEIKHVCKLAQADEFIEAMPDKYDTYIEQGGTNVSGGQKQRLCIARALLKKPKILILDDSTSAVDTHTDKLIRKAFKEEIPNTTKIIIAQRVASVEDADKIVVLDNGGINAVGTHDELLKTCAIYREVYESQNKAGGDEE